MVYLLLFFLSLQTTIRITNSNFFPVKVTKLNVSLTSYLIVLGSIQYPEFTVNSRTTKQVLYMHCRGGGCVKAIGSVCGLFTLFSLCYEAEICTILLLLRWAFLLCPFCKVSEMSNFGRF